MLARGAARLGSCFVTGVMMRKRVAPGKGRETVARRRRSREFRIRRQEGSGAFTGWIDDVLLRPYSDGSAVVRVWRRSLDGDGVEFEQYNSGRLRAPGELLQAMLEWFSEQSTYGFGLPELMETFAHIAKREGRLAAALLRAYAEHLEPGRKSRDLLTQK